MINSTRIDRLLQAKNTDERYEIILERLENEHDKNLLLKLFSLISCSRRLLLSEIETLLLDLNSSNFIIFFVSAPLIVQVSFHSIMMIFRKAVRNRYLRKPSIAIDFREKITFIQTKKKIAE
jgi:hypothetical protein